jgi:hypothetical protein
MKTNAHIHAVVLVLLMAVGSACNKEQDAIPALTSETGPTTKTSGQNWRLVEDENGKTTCPGRGETCLVYNPPRHAVRDVLDVLFEAIGSGDPSRPLAILAEHRLELSKVMKDTHIDQVIDRSLIMETSVNEATGGRFILLRDPAGALVFGYLIES